MSSLNWGLLNPENVAQLMTFEADNQEWKYQKNSESMAARQAEGVAYLWNLLAEKDVAVLADEVGMGKTFQALGIATLLWRLKSNAKILVMAPNRDICRHWVREYDTFVKRHYHYCDHRVKNIIDNGPVQSIHTCYSLDELATTIRSGVGHLFLTTIHSLSHLVPKDEKNNDKDLATLAGEKAEDIRDVLGSKAFDLIIIDEAHYFRNKGGDSQRVSAAQGFFGLTENDRLADKVLLLTATPTHSQLSDLWNILSYFTDLPPEKKDPKSLMETYGLRRLRRMQGKDNENNDQFFTKRNYRDEEGLACGFDDPASEAFFAMYQKKLVTELGMTKSGKKPLYGYLEGFESVGQDEHKSTEITSDAAQVKNQQDDFAKATDTDILVELSDRYFQKIGSFPKHPKYGALIGECVPKNLFSPTQELNEHKHLIFVRRIPSVRELTQRINAAYDEILAQEICRVLMVKESNGVNRFEDWKKKNFSRETFVNLYGGLQDEAGEELSETEDNQEAKVDENDNHLGSKISDLFVVKKNGVKRTDASNVRLRFRKSESIFSLFLEPASDYKQAGYKFYYQTEKGDKVRATYLEAAKNARFGNKQNFKSEKAAPDGKSAAFENQDELFTFWTLIYSELSTEQQEKLENWSDEAKENFANYIKAGFLYASPVMVELYVWFVEFRREGLTASAQKNYQDFYDFVRDKIKGSLLLAYFKGALDTFEQLCGKIIDHKMDDWKKEWNVLTGLQQPAWYASGDTSNKQRLILGFNSPFYPNVLIATSVFQEGVNLHLQCSKVHHYGLAGSPGANEQRVGRVDRLFGRINNQLMENGKAKLAIKYPYLEKSVDEDQVVSFLKRKFKDEDSLDNCSLASSDGTIDPTDERLKQYLRKSSEEDLEDPYPANFKELDTTANLYTALELDEAEQLNVTDYIAGLLGELINLEKERLYEIPRAQSSNEILLIDCFADESEKRKQPVVVELNFSADFSSLVKETVYTLTFKTPVASKNNLPIEIDNGFLNYATTLDNDFPLVSIAVDPNAANSNFYLYMRVNLPVFAGTGQMTFLSKAEVHAAFEQLRQAADSLECKLFSGNQDLKKEDLEEGYMNLSEKGQVVQQLVAERSYPVSNTTERWTTISSKIGNVKRIRQRIESFSKLKSRVQVPIKEGALAVFELNHSLSFIKCLPDVESDGLELVMSYPAGDIQQEERQLLEAWFDYVRGK